MAPPNDRSRRPSSRPAGRPGLDEIMEINTGDVMPLVDEDLIEVLHDDAPPVRAASGPTMMPASDRPVAKPSKVGTPMLNREPLRRAKSAPVEEPQETAVMQSLPAREAAIADKGFSNAFVYVDKGPGAGQLVPVLQGEMIIGRSTESGLQLNHPSVSRSHATLVRRGEAFFVRDNGSQNGTFVNWAKLKGEAEVFPGDQISVGTAVVLIRGGVYNSAKRRLPGGPAAQARSAEVSEAPPRRKKEEVSWVVKLAVVGASVGIGVAMVWMIAGNHGDKTEVASPTSKSAAASSDSKVTETKLVDAPKVEEKPVAPKVEAKADVKPAVAEKPAVAPVPPAEDISPKRGAAHRVVASRTTHGSSKLAAEAAPPPGPSSAPPAALKLYEAGNLDGAISTAESAGAAGAATKMVQFKTAYEAGKAALANKDGGGAISNLGKALKLDEQIDQGWGKLNGEIRGQMAGLYILAGNQAQTRGDTATAIKAFKAAQGYQPANAEARKKMQELGDGAKKPAPAASTRSAADAAFDN